MGSILSAELLKDNIHLGQGPAALIGKAIRRPMWQWHTVAGYILLGLYVVRLIVLKVEGASFENPFKKGLLPKDRLKSAIYLAFYICLAASLITGVIIVWGPKEWKGLHRTLVRIHILGMYYAVAFVIVHLGGLVLAELGNSRGIISRMIHGGSDKP